jgi:hypothetical protein
MAFPVSVQLRDGRTVTVRPIRPEASLAKRLGFSDKANPDDRGVRVVTRSLQGAAPAAP